MIIKSNKKKNGPGFLKSAYLGFLEVIPGQTTSIKILIFLGGVITSFFVWDYSGLVALFIVLFSIILIFQNDYDNFGIAERSMLSLFAVTIIYLLGTTNIYCTEDKKINVEYSKLIFTDSTEKIIIFMTYPEKRTVTQPLSTTEYYTLKDQQNDIKMFIIEKGTYEHWNKLYARESNTTVVVNEYSYSFTINSQSGEIVNDAWLKGKDKKFITALPETIQKEVK